jgi:uncharacterized protein YndB with AHSA1/START domain
MTTATTRKAMVTRTGEREIRIERTFDAPRDRVWRAFTEPKLLAQWWGRGNKLDIERDEVKRGGHWRYVEHHQGGSDGFEGRYAEVTAPERVARTFEWDGMPGHPSLDTAVFEDLGDGRTKMVATSIFLTVEDIEGMLRSGMETGMNESYAALDTLLATLA